MFTQILHFGSPPCRFMDVIANKTYEQRRESAHHKHVSPPEAAADEIVGSGGEKKTEIVAGVHPSRALGSTFLGPFFGDEGRPDRPFSTNTHARQESQNREAPNAGGKCGQQGEQ